MSQPYQPTTKRRGPLPWILGGVAVVLLLCAGFILIGALTDKNAGTAGTPAKTSTAVGSHVPVAADFKLTAKITEQTCYGEAGCAVSFVPVVAYTGPALSPSQTWVITYQVSGIESGTKVGKLVMAGSTPAKQTDKRVRTAAEDSKITLKVTSVDKG